MLHFVRRSLLTQLLSVYLLFVGVVLLGGLGVNAVVAERLRNDVQAADLALAQEIALQHRCWCSPRRSRRNSDRSAPHA
jgi:hypothetical protein